MDYYFSSYSFSTSLKDRYQMALVRAGFPSPLLSVQDNYVWSGILTCDILSCTVNDFIALFKQVWTTEKNVSKKLRDIPIPFNDVKNILDEIHFEDEVTRSRCRGWLVLPSRKYLQADILFPGCEFDCRLTIRGRTGTNHF